MPAHAILRRVRRDRPGRRPGRHDHRRGDRSSPPRGSRADGAVRARHRRRGARVATAPPSTPSTPGPASRGPRSHSGARPRPTVAVTAARRAFDEGPWPRMGFAERGALIHRLADLIGEHAEELALADTRDMGKPISDARDKDVPRAAQNFRFFADHARLATAETLPMDTGHHAYTRYEPAGVVAAIAPWNFPLMLESWKVAPALAWGNTVVLKPAEDSPASATILARLALRGRHPAGRAQRAARLRPGLRRLGAHRGPAGRPDHVHRRVRHRAGHHRRGGAQPHAGEPRARAARAPTSCSPTPTWTPPSTGRSRRSSPTPGRSAWPGRGSTSSAAILDEFLARFVAAAEALRARRPEGPGHPARPARVGDALRQGPRLRRDAGRPGRSSPAGWATAGWCGPTVVVDVAADAPIQREEVFGPVVTVTAVRHRGRGGARGERLARTG